MNSNTPGRGAAIASLVLGIIAVVCWFFGWSNIIAIVCGIVGLILAGRARRQGYNDGIRMAGFVLSLIGLIGGVIFLIACVGLAGAVVGIVASS